MPFKSGNIPWNKGLKYKRGGGMFGSSNPNYKGGKYITYEGYVYIRVNGKRKLEHRYVAEQLLGRPLKKNEVIHHIDGNKLNNEPNNLFICTMSNHKKIENDLANRYKKEHFNSDESRSEFVKMYGNLGTDCRNAHGKLTGVTT